MKEMALSGKRGEGKSVKLDDEDFEKYSHLVWHLSSTGYAVRRDDGETTRLHRLIMNCPEGLVVDHLNGDRLDCRKSNMRVCTQKDNSRNRHDTKGYCFDKTRQKWIVRYHKKFYGRYNSEVEAQKAYKLARSGVEYEPKQRQKYMLPKNIYRQCNKWGYAIQVNGIRHRKNGYATLAEAQKGLKLKLQELRIVL